MKERIPNTLNIYLTYSIILKTCEKRKVSKQASNFSKKTFFYLLINRDYHQIVTRLDAKNVYKIDKE